MTDRANLPAFSDLSRSEIILTKHYFEHGDIVAACVAAGYRTEKSNAIRHAILSETNRMGRLYRELCRDRVESTIITAEKKRLRVWDLVKWAVGVNERGKPNDSGLALKCIDMLNRMDGHYAAVKIDSKQQIQKQTVSFSQKIGQSDNNEKVVKEEQTLISTD